MSYKAYVNAITCWLISYKAYVNALTCRPMSYKACVDAITCRPMSYKAYVDWRLPQGRGKRSKSVGQIELNVKHPKT